MKEYVGIGANKDVTVVRGDNNSAVCIEIRAVSACFKNNVAGTCGGGVCCDCQIPIVRGNFQVVTLLLVSMDSLEILVNFLEIISNCLETFIRGTSKVTTLLLA